MRLRDLGEFGLIERLAQQVSRTADSVALGIGDDAAVVDLPAGHQLVATLDTLLEDVHFRKEWTTPEDLGWKALAVSVSDLGAMAASPRACLVSLALPPETETHWIEALYAGLAECAERYGCPVVGGDTVRSPRGVTITVVALGAAPAERIVRREGAKPGDLLCVTGVLGDSAAGLALLERGGEVCEREEYSGLLAWHRRPLPPVEAGVALAQRGLSTAMIDLSDGLASDLVRLRERGGVGAVVRAERLPIADAARRAAEELGVNSSDWALHGGEDYQLMFTVSPDRWDEVPPALGPLGVTATIIGEMGGDENRLVHPDGRSELLRPTGFRHFGE